MRVAKVFADTNIVLRAFHDDFAEHASVRALLDLYIASDAQIFISRQVIREYLVQVTHPRTFVEPLSIESLSKHLHQITRICIVLDETERVTAHLMKLIGAYPTRGKQIHDANLVATMLAYEIDTLLTLNVADLKRFGDKIKIVSLEEGNK
ncbi:type II toxin-antitoxin system VapC family toxin [Anaerolineales bacterium]